MTRVYPRISRVFHRNPIYLYDIMSDSIKHECGIAFIRLLKPADYYLKKYGTSFYGLNKMHILMEKQHNRGQDSRSTSGSTKRSRRTRRCCKIRCC